MIMVIDTIDGSEVQAPMMQVKCTKCGQVIGWFGADEDLEGIEASHEEHDCTDVPKECS